MISMLWLAQKSFWGKFGILTVSKSVHSLIQWYCWCVCPSLWSPRLQMNTQRDWIKSWNASKNSLNLKPSKNCFLRERESPTLDVPLGHWCVSRHWQDSDGRGLASTKPCESFFSAWIENKQAPWCSICRQVEHSMPIYPMAMQSYPSELEIYSRVLRKLRWPAKFAV